MDISKDSLQGRIKRNVLWTWNQDKRLGIKYTRGETFFSWLLVALTALGLLLAELTTIPNARLALLGISLFPIICWLPIVCWLVIIYGAAMRRLEELVKSQQNPKTGGE
jgi:hypothetical protein